MLNLKFPLATAATALLGFAASASADTPPQSPPVVPAGADACPQPDASCPKPGGQTAQAEPAPAPTTNNYNYNAPPPPPPSAEETTNPWAHQLGFSVGGGVDDFANGAQRSVTNIGGSWNARLIIGTRSWIAGEISYIGSAQTANMGPLRESQTLFGNGAQGDLRINPTGPLFNLQPFVFGGGAWRHYSTSGNNSISANVWEIPAGLGFAGYISDLMIDVRGEYRFASDDTSLARDLGMVNTGSSFARWGVNANLGYVF